MKTCLLFFSFLIINLASVASALDFVGIPERTKRYVVKNLSRVAKEHEIFLVQIRHDILFFEENKAHLRFISMFRLYEALNVAELKTSREKQRGKSICLDLKNFRTLPNYSCRNDMPSPYLPTIVSPDEYVRLVFAEHEPDWNDNKLDFRFATNPIYVGMPNWMSVLTPKELIETNGESEFFSNKVVRIDSTCVFKVDVSVPKIANGDAVFSKNIHNHENAVAKARESCNLIHLSNTEVSEIVYLAYRLKGYKEGRSEYKNARAKNPKILKPVEKLQTKIGKMLATELYPKGLVEFRDDTHSLK